MNLYCFVQLPSSFAQGFLGLSSRQFDWARLAHLVNAFAHFFAGFEVGDVFRRDFDFVARLRMRPVRAGW